MVLELLYVQRFLPVPDRLAPAEHIQEYDIRVIVQMYEIHFLSYMQDDWTPQRRYLGERVRGEYENLRVWNS